MTLAECRGLKKGDKVKWSLGNGWYQSGEFVKLVQVTTFGKMTLSQVMDKNFTLENGKQKTEAMVMSEGKTHYISTRRLKKC